MDLEEGRSKSSRKIVGISGCGLIAAGENGGGHGGMRVSRGNGAGT
jgi:hypothetical protein